MTIVLGIALAWLLAAGAWCVIFCVLGRRPLTETERRCGQIDRALDGGRERTDRGDDLVGLRAV